MARDLGPSSPLLSTNLVVSVAEYMFGAPSSLAVAGLSAQGILSRSNSREGGMAARRVVVHVHNPRTGVTVTERKPVGHMSQVGVRVP